MQNRHSSERPVALNNVWWFAASRALYFVPVHLHSTSRQNDDPTQNFEQDDSGFKVYFFTASK